jgi:hypothetical protein
LILDGKTFSCFTKGKSFSGELTDGDIKFLKGRVSLKKLFAGMSVKAVAKSVGCHVERLFRLGKIKARYSCHDFRHYFAVRE